MVYIFHTNSILNLFMIRYVTMAYAFFLVVTTIVVLRPNSCCSCVKLCRRCGRRNTRGSIVDQLPAFLVFWMCCCHSSDITNVTHSGLYNLTSQHIKTVAMCTCMIANLTTSVESTCSMQSLLFFVFILIPPPLILLLEPLLTKLFNMNCFTSTPVKWLYNRLWLKLSRLVPGLLEGQKSLFCRFLIPLSSVISTKWYMYMYTEPRPTALLWYCRAIFFLILLFHSLIQPYKKKWHSLLDLYPIISLIF